MTGIIIAACAVGVTGLLLGLFLGFMGKKFAVEVDQKEIDVRAELPGNNCGGCGYAGCDALAKAIAAGEADCGACPVGGAAVAAKIAAIMGAEAGSQERMTAFVKCGGDCDKAKNNYVYSGVQDCTMMNIAPNGGPKGCTYGCMGYGSCVKACPFDAIRTLLIGLCNIWHIRSKEIYKITIFSGILIISVLSQHSDLLWLRAVRDVPYRQYGLVSGRGPIELIVLLKCRTNTLFHNDQSIAVQIHFPDLSV